MAYYAIYQFNKHSISERDRLMRFETKLERDEMIERINNAHTHTHASATTALNEQYRFPIRKFYNDPWSEYVNEVQHLKTCCNRNFFECKPYRN